MKNENGAVQLFNFPTHVGFLSSISKGIASTLEQREAREERERWGDGEQGMNSNEGMDIKGSQSAEDNGVIETEQKRK